MARKARTLLDPSFETRMTPVLLPWIYLFLVLAILVVSVAAVVAAFVFTWWAGVVALLVVPIGAAGVFALLRVVCELLIDFAQMPQIMKTMAAGLVRMEGTVDGVAEDMPRIAFLRSGPRKPVQEADRLRA